MKPVPQLRCPLLTEAALSCITMNAGRFSLTVPRPYVTHAPSEGRPPTMEPVFIWLTPLEWFRPLAQQERMTARSSAQVAMFGSQSETESPLSPCLAQRRRDARIGE